MANFHRRGALLIGAALWLAASPVHAKKEAQPTGPAVEMSDSFRLAAAAATESLRSGNISAASGQIAGLSPMTAAEQYAAAGLRLELATRRQDVPAKRIALTELLKSSMVPPSEAPRLRFLAGLYAFYVGNYDDTLAQLNIAESLGYDGIDATLLRADTYMRQNKLKDARPLVDQAFAKMRASGQPIPVAWYDKAIALAYRADDWNKVGTLYRERLALAPSAGNWRSGIANSLAQPNIKSEAQLDYYRLQAAVGAMASERDYQAYAALAEKNGYNAEAKAIIEAGRSAGKLAPAQPATAKLYQTVTPKAKKDMVGLPAKAAKAKSGTSANDALTVADSYFSLSQFPQAVEFYRLALARNVNDSARANSRLGIALARSGDLATARTMLAGASGDWTTVAGLWDAWVDQQATSTATLPITRPAG